MPQAKLKVVEPPPPRSPEREALAAAIERRGVAAVAVTRAEEARGRASQLWHAAEQAVETAKADLVCVKAGEARRIVDRLLASEVDDGRNPVRDAEASLAKAVADERTAEAARDLLDEEIRSAGKNLELVDVGLRDAVGKALAADPAVAALITEFDAARRRLGDLRGAMSAVSRALGLPEEVARFWQNEPAGGFASPSSAAWHAAVEALRSDAGAPLPAVEPAGRD